MGGGFSETSDGVAPEARRRMEVVQGAFSETVGEAAGEGAREGFVAEGHRRVLRACFSTGSATCGLRRYHGQTNTFEGNHI